MALRTASNERGAEVMHYTDSGLRRMHEVRECQSAKLICILIINYCLGSDISYHPGGRISILASSSRKFSRNRH